MTDAWSDMAALAAWAPRQPTPAPQPAPAPVITPQAFAAYCASPDGQAAAAAAQHEPTIFELANQLATDPVDEIALARYRADINQRWAALEPARTHHRNAA